MAIKYEPREHVIDAELASGNLDAWKQALGFPSSRRPYMPDHLVVVLNRDADEAGDYRVMPHSEAVDNPNWTIMHDMVPGDLD